MNDKPLEVKKKIKEPTSAIIKFVCDHCGQLNEIEGSYDQKTYSLRLYFAKCRHCGHGRNEEEIVNQYFQCVGPCGVIYRKTRNWKPRKGLCPVCNMRQRRKDEKM